MRRPPPESEREITVVWTRVGAEETAKGAQVWHILC